MKRTQIDCDCCQSKNVESSIKLKLPILWHGKNPYMYSQKMDICQECANRIMKLYYDIAAEHGSTGMHGIVEGEEE